MVVDDYKIDPNGGFQVLKDALKVLVPGEKRLMLALFREALDSLKRYFIKKYLENKDAAEEAYDWFFEESDLDYIFSFENVCAILLYDPRAVRQALKRIENAIRQTPDIARYFLKADFMRLCLSVSDEISKNGSSQNNLTENEIKAYLC